MTTEEENNKSLDENDVEEEETSVISISKLMRQRAQKEAAEAEAAEAEAAEAAEAGAIGAAEAAEAGAIGAAEAADTSKVDSSAQINAFPESTDEQEEWGASEDHVVSPEDAVSDDVAENEAEDAVPLEDVSEELLTFGMDENWLKKDVPSSTIFEKLGQSDDSAESDDLDEADAKEEAPFELQATTVEPEGETTEAQPLPAPEINLDQEMEVVETLFEEQLHLEGKVEAIVFGSPKPMKATEIAELFLNEGEEVTPKQIEQILRQLHQSYRERRGGFHLAFIKGEGYQFQTVKSAAPLMERLFSERPRPLSRAALETLSIIAYRQPVTRADVEYIRGVDAGNIIKNLMDRNMVACVGRREDAGRPMVFGTTDEFLKIFRISKISDLPPLSSFQPAPELIAQAQEMLAQREEMIDVEPFIADTEKPLSEVSGGVLDAEESQGFIGDETTSPLVLEEPPSEDEWIAAQKGQHDDGNENTEMASPARGSVTSGSGEDDLGGEDLPERQGP